MRSSRFIAVVPQIAPQRRAGTMQRKRRFGRVDGNVRKIRRLSGEGGSDEWRKRFSPYRQTSVAR
jgi:predicted secreted protein